jgi:hypothetical protein
MQLIETMAKAYQSQFGGLSDLARTLCFTPITNTMVLQVGDFVAELANSGFQSVAPAQDAGPEGLQKFSDREVAAMVAVAVFLLVYISLGLAIKHNSQLAHLAAIDGPTPFDAAMAAGGFAFGTWMHYSRRNF